MRLLATLILAGTASLWTAFAQDTESNMSCVGRLQMPVYPPLANQARISGQVTATVVVASDGSVQTKVVGLFSPRSSRVRFVHPGFE